jgi:formylglycine-generating enzyme required for sulfatase activity
VWIDPRLTPISTSSPPSQVAKIESPPAVTPPATPKPDTPAPAIPPEVKTETPLVGNVPPLAKAPFDPKKHQTAWARHLRILPYPKNSIGMNLVFIPPGEFLMGRIPGELTLFPANGMYKEEATQHPVTLTKSYFIGMTEVTQKHWQEVMGTEPWQGKAGQTGDDYPATYTTKKGASDFCLRLSQKEGVTYRLPTEAEWEFACRAGTDTVFFFGNDKSLLGQFAVSSGGLHKVGTKQPNPWGLFDMYGNLWEWVMDGHEAFTSKALVDPLLNVGDQRSVIRGSCYRSVIPSEFSSAARHSWPGSLATDEKGFRVVCEVNDAARKLWAVGKK